MNTIFATAESPWWALLVPAMLFSFFFLLKWKINWCLDKKVENPLPPPQETTEPSTRNDDTSCVNEERKLPPHPTGGKYADI